MRDWVSRLEIRMRGTDFERRLLKDALELRALARRYGRGSFDRETYDCISNSLRLELEKYSGGHIKYFCELFEGARVAE